MERAGAVITSSLTTAQCSTPCFGGHTVLWDIMKEKDALYAKHDFDDADGIRASELEERFAELEGWNAESDAAGAAERPWHKEDRHGMLMRDVSANEKVRVLLAKASSATLTIFSSTNLPTTLTSKPWHGSSSICRTSRTRCSW